ncbi:MAG TPA: MFS transporter [Legionellaceae bacterium]|nr:MFS transporter [Legionellaceae bacterium]
MKKHQEIVLMLMISLMYTTVCMETDIYVPAFPDMKLFFVTTSDAIQTVLSINFIGICLGSLLFGPLSDTFGRKKTLHLGLILFAIASWCCLMFNNFHWFLLSRLLQGIGAAAPMVISFAMILEQYQPERVAQICGGINLFITGVMALAPVLGSYLNLYYGWQSTFLLIAVLASVAVIGAFFLPETLAVEKRTPCSLPKIIKHYGMVLSNFPFMGAAMICYMLFGALVVFTANLSLIFIDYLGVSKQTYGFYQAISPACFALFSFLSIGIIGKYGMEKTKLMGLKFAILGSLLLLSIAFFFPNPVYICAAMVIFTIGITLAAPIYGIESANVFPEMRGIATGMSNALRHIITAAMVGIGMVTFNGSIKPVALLIVLSTMVVSFLAIRLLKKPDAEGELCL